MHLKKSSTKLRPFCLGLNMLIGWIFSAKMCMFVNLDHPGAPCWKLNHTCLNMDHFVYAPSQWETTLQSHWMGAYTKWCLRWNLFGCRWYRFTFFYQMTSFKTAEEMSSNLATLQVLNMVSRLHNILHWITLGCNYITMSYIHVFCTRASVVCMLQLRLCYTNILCKLYDIPLNEKYYAHVCRKQLRNTVRIKFYGHKHLHINGITTIK